MRPWTLPLSIATLWVCVSLISLVTRCLLTDDVRCSRWGPDHGAGYGHPISTSALHSIFVGSALILLLIIKDVAISRQRPRLFDTSATIRKIRLCLRVGCSFGCKSVVGHMALRHTPTAIFELLHGMNLLFVVAAAWIMVGEKPRSGGEVISLAGVVVGSIITASASFTSAPSENQAIGLFAFILNVANGMLAGIVVASLRWTTLKMKETPSYNMTITELTCFKILIGAAFVLPLALLLEGPRTIIVLDSMQRSLMLISSAIILIHHLNLSLLCYLAPALVVGIVEALKPLPALLIEVVVQKLPQTTAKFWVGSFITLAAAITFKLFRTLYGRDDDDEVGIRRSSSRQYLLVGRPRVSSERSASYRQELGHRLLESGVPLNERIGNDAESASDSDMSQFGTYTEIK